MSLATASVLRLFVHEVQKNRGLIIVCTLISVAALLALRLIFAAAAPVTEFLFIAGGTDAALAGVAVVGGGTGVRKFIIGSLF